MSSREMITLLIDIVSKGGNLLLDVGPMHDGSLSHIQENRLNDLADWMDINSEGIELTLDFHQYPALTRPIFVSAVSQRAVNSCGHYFLVTIAGFFATRVTKF